MDGNQTQILFFNHIKTKIPPYLSFVDEVAEDLSISNDSAYRRIRGEKPLSLEEAQVLSDADPAVQAGRLVSELHPWMIHRGILLE